MTLSDASVFAVIGIVIGATIVQAILAFRSDRGKVLALIVLISLAELLLVPFYAARIYTRSSFQIVAIVNAIFLGAISICILVLRTQRNYLRLACSVAIACSWSIAANAASIVC
jgi:hypothetical protein